MSDEPLFKNYKEGPFSYLIIGAIMLGGAFYLDAEYAQFEATPGRSMRMPWLFAIIYTIFGRKGMWWTFLIISIGTMLVGLKMFLTREDQEEIEDPEDQE